MTLVLDAGAFVALERDDRAMWRRLKDAQRQGDPPVTHGGIVAQVWRGGARQARLARALVAVEVRPLDNELGRRAGVLIARSGVTDAVDAALVALARPDDQIVTSDADDIGTLADAGRLRVDVVPA